MREGTLMLSSNTGRYALDGLDITSGDVCEIFLDGRWHRGSVEHVGGLYAQEGNRQGHGGYYFLSVGGVCGLCVGMRVRLLEDS